MIVGGYDLHLYCRFKNCVESRYTAGVFNQSTGQYSASSIGGAYHEAREAGWHFIKGDCVCKACWKRGRRWARIGDGVLASE